MNETKQIISKHTCPTYKQPIEQQNASAFTHMSNEQTKYLGRCKKHTCSSNTQSLPSLLAKFLERNALNIFSQTLGPESINEHRNSSDWIKILNMQR